MPQFSQFEHLEILHCSSSSNCREVLHESSSSGSLHGTSLVLNMDATHEAHGLQTCLVAGRLQSFSLLYVLHWREVQHWVEVLTFWQKNKHFVFSESRRSSEEGRFFEKFDICRRQFPPEWD